MLSLRFVLTLSLIFVGTAPFFIPLTAHADDAGTEFKLTGHVGFLSDYRFRGVSLTDEEPVLQGSLVAKFGQFYFGGWSSPIDLPEADVEVDLFVGYRLALAPDTELTVQAAYITFPGESDAHFLRLTADITKKFDAGFTLGARVDYEPEMDDSFREAGDNTYVALRGATKIADIRGNPLNLTAGIGYEDGSAADEKTDWNIGLNYEAHGLNWSLQYIDTDSDAPNADGTALFGIVYNF